MLDLTSLADLGRASVQAFWLPVGLWTALALAVEAGLRLGRARAALALPVRGAVLSALPLAVAVPALLEWLAPEATRAVTGWAPAVQWLPEITVGGPAPTLAARGPAALDVALGLVAVVGVLVAVAHLARLAAAVAGVIRTRQTLAPADAERQRAVDLARRRLGVTRPVAAVAAPDGAAPFTVGWHRPLVALPDGLDPAALEVAAVHEVAHVRRGDFAWHLAQRVVTSAFAAHPLVWVVGRGLDLDRERAADALVLAACPGRRRTYADLLFSYAALPAPTLALGAATGSSFLKHRIDAMTSPLSQLSRGALRTGRALGTVLLIAVASLALLAAAPDAPIPPTDDPPVERIEFGRGEGGMPTLDIYLAAGQARDDADDIAREVDAGMAAGAETARLRVHYDGGILDRNVTLSPGKTSLGNFRIYRPADLSTKLIGTTLRVGEVTEAADQAKMRAEDLSETPADTTDIFDVAEVQPELIGGLAALQALVEYPKLAKEAGIQGTVVVQFVVNEEGRVTNPVAVRSPHDMLAQAAIAAVRQARFTPGRQRGEPVKVRFAVPIAFRLAGTAAASETSARAALFPNTRLVLSGLDMNALNDSDRRLVEHMLVASGQIVREDSPALSDGAQATIRFRVDNKGQLVQRSLQTNSENEALGGLSRGLVGIITYPSAPWLAGQTVEFTTTYVRGD